MLVLAALITFALRLTSGAAENESMLSDRKQTGAEWGEPVEGWQLCIATDKKHYVFGEKINLTITLKNSTKEERTVGIMVPYGVLEFDVKLSSQRQIPKTLYGTVGWEPATKGTSKTFKPGEELSRTLPLNRLFDMSMLGDYTISITRSDLTSQVGKGKFITLNSNSIIVSIGEEEAGDKSAK